MKNLGTLLIGLLVSSPMVAQANVIDFSDEICDEQTVCVKNIVGDELGGTTATFSNPVVESGTPTDFFNLSNGLALGASSLASTWDVVFDASVEWIGGFLGFTSNNLGFSVAGPGVDADGLLAGATSGSFSLTQPLVFTGGETYSFASANTCTPETSCGGLTFRTLEFNPVSDSGPEVSVPEPGALMLLSLGLAGIGFSRRQRRR